MRTQGRQKISAPTSHTARYPFRYRTRPSTAPAPSKISKYKINECKNKNQNSQCVWHLNQHKADKRSVHPMSHTARYTLRYRTRCKLYEPPISLTGSNNISLSIPSSGSCWRIILWSPELTLPIFSANLCLSIPPLLNGFGDLSSFHFQIR
jgi:hypothetical protein